MTTKKYLTFDAGSMGNDLLPTKLDGKEGISMPFSYEVTLISTSRDIADKANSPATSLIGTTARIGILVGPDNDNYTHRTGIISQFELSGTLNPGGLQDNWSVYKATLIPAVQMLGQQSAFRIFEDQDVVTIINALLSDMKSRFSNFLYDTSRLKSADFQKMEYCVQYGESTFGFLCRLMERFGIWYMFDGDETDSDSDSSNEDGGLGDDVMVASNTTMVLGRLPFQSPDACDIDTHTITDNDPKLFNDKDPEYATIGNFRRLSMPVTQNSWFGNFNMLNPTRPILKSDKFADSSNVLVANTSVAGFCQSEEFPGQFENDPGADEGSTASGQGDRNAADYAATRMQQQRVLSSKITGATINPTLQPGRTFTITSDQNSQGEPGDYLVTFMTISAFENSYQTTGMTDFINFIWRDFLFSPFTSLWSSGDSASTVDFMGGIAVAGLNNYLQNEQAYALQRWWYPKDDNPNALGHIARSNFPSYTVGGITQVGITSTIPLLIADIRKDIAQNHGAYTNTFVALQNPSSGGYMAPTPSPGPRPIAHGPHLAVVIGPSGVDRNQEVYADAIGRVRIRFPWDPGPPSTANGLPGPWSSLSPPDKPYHVGQNTCWARVSEGWAGQQFGSQFLPRNGQEVLVGFIDGNPERPIIIGRVYNASSGVTNLPYPSKSAAQKLLNKLSDLKGTASSLMYRSGIKTRSVPQPKSGRGFHMLRFDDTGGSEQLLLRSQGRLDVTALGTKFETIGGDRNLTVGGIDHKHHVVGGNYISKVFQDYTLHVGDPSGPYNGGHRFERVEQEYELNVVKDMLVSLEANLSAEVAEVASLSAGSIVLEATNKITLKVGNNWIVISPAGVFANGQIIGDNSGGSADTATVVQLTQPIANPAHADPGTT
jgi:uncharacterized protein involved in type VI secretion and phage assembly